MGGESFTNWYKFLGVDENASWSAIEDALGALNKRKNKLQNNDNRASPQEELRELADLKDALEQVPRLLKDPIERAKYDQDLKRRQQGGGGDRSASRQKSSVAPSGGKTIPSDEEQKEFVRPADQARAKFQFELDRLLPIGSWERLRAAERLRHRWAGIAPAVDIDFFELLIREAGLKLSAADRRQELEEVLPINSRERLGDAKDVLEKWRQQRAPRLDLDYLSGEIVKAETKSYKGAGCGLVALWAFVGAPALFLTYICAVSFLGMFYPETFDATEVRKVFVETDSLAEWTALFAVGTLIAAAIFVLILVATVRSRKPGWKRSGGAANA